jgi:D-psicose/D-tagatose/L-ribulose 3-epimerase
MKIAISNIAWEKSEQDAVKQIMLERNILGVEIAPTKIWTNPETVSPAQLRQYKEYWEKSGICVVALQSLLFGHPEMTIFESEEQRNCTLEYLKMMIDLAAAVGAAVLVFGSPKNRSAGYTGSDEDKRVAIAFFSALGDHAQNRGVSFCIEPNAAQYNCRFVRNTDEALELVRSVNNPGFRLHLDAGVMALNEESVDTALTSAQPFLCHFHISQPQLAPVGEGLVDHQRLGKLLRDRQYDRWVSIEMRSSDDGANTETVRKTLDFVRGVYS